MFNVPEYYQRLAGAVFIGDRSLATGTLDESKGLFFLGDVSELTLDPSQEFVEHQEHQSGDGRKDVKIPRLTEIKGSLTVDNTGAENFKNFLRSKLTVIPGATVTAEPYTAPAAGKFFLINSDFVASVASITNPSGTVTYTEGSDYLINGRVVRIPLGSPLAETAIAINYVSGSGVDADLFGESFQEFYLYFNGKNTINGDTITLELFKVSFDPAAIGNLLGDDILQMTVPFEALWEPLQDGEGLGGFGAITRNYKGIDLFTDTDIVQNGDSFTITFITSTPGTYPYTITGVNSADIDGEPLTGEFTASGETRTFTVGAVNKNFLLSLDNGAANVGVIFLGCEPSSASFSDPLSSLANWSFFSESGSGNWDVDVAIVGSKLRATTQFEGSPISRIWQSNFSYTPQYEDEIVTFNLEITAQFMTALSSGAQPGTQLFNFFLIQNGAVTSSGFQSVSNTSPHPVTRTGTLQSFGGTLQVGVPIYLALGFGNSTADGLTINVVDYWDFTCTVTVTCP